tara:strand:+ start:993 stop:1778 length:786 start_codon:yes stop_codon:yes gene_type:complete
MAIEQLKDSVLCEQFCAQVKLHRLRNGHVMLQTPFSFPDGDQYSIYLEDTRTGGIKIHDGGSTLMRLSYENDIDRLFEGTRAVVMSQAIREHGVDFDDESGQFFVETAVSELAAGTFRLGQAITRVNDLTFLNRSRVTSTFYDDLGTQLRDVLPAERLSENYTVPDIADASNYPVDYKFDGRSGLPVFLFGVPNRDKARLVTIYLQYYLQNSVSFDSIIVFENQETIHRSDLARLSNVGGEMVSSLNAVSDFRRKIERRAA